MVTASHCYTREQQQQQQAPERSLGERAAAFLPRSSHSHCGLLLDAGGATLLTRFTQRKTPDALVCDGGENKFMRRVGTFNRPFCVQCIHKYGFWCYLQAAAGQTERKTTTLIRPRSLYPAALLSCFMLCSNIF